MIYFTFIYVCAWYTGSGLYPIPYTYICFRYTGSGLGNGVLHDLGDDDDDDDELTMVSSRSKYAQD